MLCRGACAPRQTAGSNWAVSCFESTKGTQQERAILGGPANCDMPNLTPRKSVLHLEADCQISLLASAARIAVFSGNP